MLNNEDFIENEGEPAVILLEDDLGNEREFEFLDVIEYEGDEYLILLPLEEGDQGDECMILRIESLDDQTESYVGIDDEALLEAVFAVFKERYKDEFDFDE